MEKRPVDEDDGDPGVKEIMYSGGKTWMCDRCHQIVDFSTKPTECPFCYQVFTYEEVSGN